MKKVVKTITLPLDIVEWIEEGIKKGEFGSFSHAILKALLKLKEDYEG